MSGNLDLVRSIYAAWERGDWSSVDWAHTEFELVFSDGPTRGQWIGLGAVADAWREFLGTWEEYRIEPEEYRELDGERLLVLVRIFGRGKTSGLDLGEMGAKGANLFYLRDGKVRRLLSYGDRDRAFADLGLQE